MTDDIPQPASAFSVVLPKGLWWWLLAGFVAGLLLFALFFLDTGNKEFFRGDGSTVDGDPIALAPLPRPLSEGGDTELPPPVDGHDNGAFLVEETPPPALATEPSLDTEAESMVTPSPSPMTTNTVAEAPPVRIPELSPAPEYPATALRRGLSGSVLLDVDVDAQGRPTNVSYARRSGSRDLDRAAARAVEQWRFTPATVNGQPVAGRVQIPIDFTP